MNDFRRRDILKYLGLASVGVAAIQTGCSREPTTQGVAATGPAAKLKALAMPKTAAAPKQLNVVLHGMMALVLDYTVNPRALQIRVPVVAGHTYGAGQWTVEKAVDSSNNPYELKNVSDSMVLTQPAVGASNDVVIDWKKSNISGFGQPPYCTLSLPFPDSITPIRPRPKTVGHADFFVDGSTKRNNGLGNLTQIPLVHVLKYTKLAANPVANPPTLGKIEIPFDNDGVARLHVFAEPAFGANDPNSIQHLNYALGQLNQLFNPPLDLSFDKNSDAGIAGDALHIGDSTMDDREQLSLEEHRALCNPLPLAGTSPRNCMGLIVVNLP